MTSVERLISVASNEIGYIEKASNKDLDSKTKNAGNKNYTKYARDLVQKIGGPYAQGVAWCDIFVDWCFVTAFGVDAAKIMLGDWSAYTPTSANYYKNANRWYTSNPRPGDQIFFKNTQRIHHTGIVLDVTETQVVTIEGNTSSEQGVVANGGCVRKKAYNLNDKAIAGYGRPLFFDNAPVKSVYYDGIDITETLNPEVFDVKKYRKAYADLDSAFGDNWPEYHKHYAMFGAGEIRQGLRKPFM